MDDLIQPKDPTDAPEAAQAAPDQSPATTTLPEPLLRMPAIQGLLAGQPGALSARLKDIEGKPNTALIVKNKDALMSAGIGFYRSLSGNVAVMFNALHVHPEELKAADSAGKLLDIAPPFDAVNSKLAKAGMDHPLLNAQTPAGPKTAPVPNPPGAQAMPGVPQQGQDAAKKMLTARLMNLQAGSPTQGANAGQGSLLRSIMKPIV